jgi:hypothetical protein
MSSIPQQLVPNGSGYKEFLRAQLTMVSNFVVKKSDAPSFAITDLLPIQCALAKDIYITHQQNRNEA